MTTNPDTQRAHVSGALFLNKIGLEYDCPGKQVTCARAIGTVAIVREALQLFIDGTPNVTTGLVISGFGYGYSWAKTGLIFGFTKIVPKGSDSRVQHDSKQEGLPPPPRP